jgi:hypothetical protein
VCHPLEVESPTPVTTGTEVAVELVLVAGTEAPATGSLVEMPVGATAMPLSPQGRGSGAYPT